MNAHMPDNTHQAEYETYARGLVATALYVWPQSSSGSCLVVNEAGLRIFDELPAMIATVESSLENIVTMPPEKWSADCPGLSYVVGALIALSIRYGRIPELKSWVLSHLIFRDEFVYAAATYSRIMSMHGITRDQARSVAKCLASIEPSFDNKEFHRIFPEDTIASLEQ